METNTEKQNIHGQDVITKRRISKRIYLALFIIIGFALFVVAIFVIGSKQNLFTPTFKLNSEFEKVGGLKEGSTVRFSGIGVGTVEKIIIIDINKVRIEMTIENRVNKFIKKDSRATIVSEGLVGNKIVELTSGTSEAQSVENNDIIASIKPIETEDILKNLKETGDNTTAMTKDLAEIINRVNHGQGTIGQLMTNDELYRKMDYTMQNFSESGVAFNNAIRNISGNVDKISGDITNLTPRIREITNDIAEISRKMNSSESVVGTLLTDTVFANNLKKAIINVNHSAENLEQGTYSFSQDMEALKHNFLFKGYFEDIGYWDKNYDKDVNKKMQQLKLKEQQLEERERLLEEREKKNGGK